MNCNATDPLNRSAECVANFLVQTFQSIQNGVLVSIDNVMKGPATASLVDYGIVVGIPFLILYPLYKDFIKKDY